MGYYSKFTEWNIVFQSKAKYLEFLKDIKNLKNANGTTNWEESERKSDISLYCPINYDKYSKQLNFTVYSIKNDGDIDFFKENEEIIVVELKDVREEHSWLKKDERKLYGRESWIPFLAKYVVGSFKVKDEDRKGIWGVNFFGDGSFEYLGTLS